MAALATFLAAAPPLLADLPAAGGNLLANGGFDGSLAGWQPSGPASFSPSEGAAAPGALRVAGPLGIAGALVAFQCVPVTPGRRYDLSASVRMPYRPKTTGGVSFRLAWHGGAACSGAVLRGAPALTFESGPPFVWKSGSRRGVVAPSGAVSASLTAVAHSEGEEPFEAFVDDVSFGPVAAEETLVVPTSATVDGANGERFQTDLWVRNPEPEGRAFVLRFRCRAGEPCNTSVYNLLLGPRETRVFPDVLGSLFNRRNSAGALEVTYDPEIGPLQVFSRAGTVHAARPGNGTVVPAVPSGSARRSARFVGIAGSPDGGTTTFRVNAGAYNPGDGPAAVTLRLLDDQGRLLATVERTWAPKEWAQLNDVGATAPGTAVLDLESTLPVHPFVIAVDNRSGDPTWIEPQERFQP